MQAITDKPAANQKVSAGKLIMQQGSSASTLVVLQKGSVSIRLAHRSELSDTAKALESSRFLYSLQAPAVIGATALIRGEPQSYFVLADNDSVVSVYRSNRESLLKIISTKPNIAVLILRTILREARENYNKLQNVTDYYNKLLNAIDSISLAYSKLNPDNFQVSDAESKTGSLDPVLPQARIIVEAFNERGGHIPEKIDKDFLYKNHADILEDDYDPGIEIDKDQFNYISRFASLPSNILGAIAQKDADFFLLSANELGKIFDTLISEVNDMYIRTHEFIESLVSGDYSWIEKFAIHTELVDQNLIMADRDETYYTAEFLLETIDNFSDRFFRSWGVKPPSQPHESRLKIENFLHATPEPVEETDDDTSIDDLIDANLGDDEAEAGGPSAAEEELKDSVKKIAEWIGISNEKYSEFQQLWTELKGQKSPLDSDNEVRRLRRKINALFWEFYEQGIKKYMKQRDNLPKYMELFFNYGFMDETMLEPEQLEALYNTELVDEVKYPVYTSLEWLTRIYDKKETTSINELGLTYFDVVKQENRDKGWKRPSDLPAEYDTPEIRLNWELKNMLQSAAKLTSGSIMNHLSILTKYQITQNINKSIVTKKALCDELDRLLSIDFSAYHREILYSSPDMGINREFIQVQVIPNFILAPTAGTLFQFWMEREGKVRDSRGRLPGPAINTEDLFTMLTNVTAAYRWEMLKTTLGVDWNNISTSSLTADYTDYVQFYRKNRELSPEVKEKLAAEFKRFRDDRQRFVHDYNTYVKYESEGTQRLNKVVRKIFTKHMPFAKEIREHLLKLPNFTDFINKSNNIRKKKARELEPRYKKYRTENGSLPPELEENYRFYNMEY